MKNMSLSEIALAVGGQYYGDEVSLTQCVTAVTIDSRKIENGCLFVPIKGAKVDGHTLIPEVMQKGALCTLTEQPLENVAHPYILVKSCKQALKNLAEHYRKGILSLFHKCGNVILHTVGSE